MSDLAPLRHAIRGLSRSSGFTVAAVLILGLGLGASSALLTLVHTILVRPLPYPAAGELVVVWEHNRPRDRLRNVVSPANYLLWREQATSFTDLALYTWTGLTLLEGGEPERVSGRAVTPNLFDVLGTAPALGRGFAPADGESAGAPVVLLSHGLWQSRFGGDPSIVGRSIKTADGTVEVVGVMPRDFLPLGQEQYWRPLRLGPEDRVHRGRSAVAIGRLKPGRTPEQAQAEMTAITARLEREYSYNAGWGANVVPLHQEVVGEVRRPLLFLLGATALVLLACASNVGNLLLIRAAARRRDLMVRRALGASRGRLIREWVLESSLVAVAAAGVGALLAWWSVDLVARLMGSGLPRAPETGLTGATVAGMTLVALAVGIGLGLATIAGALRGDPGDALRGATSRVHGGRGTARLRRGLVVAQVMLAVVLLYGTGLLLRSFGRLAAADPGFEPRGVLTADLSLPGTSYGEDEEQRLFFDGLLGALRERPGVTAAGLTDYLPFAGMGAATSFVALDRPEPEAGQAPVAAVRIADSGFFAAMGMPVLLGRGFGRQDGPGSAPVILVSQSLARGLWPDQSPIGQRLRVSYMTPDEPLEVIGVVGDVHHDGLDQAPRPTIYYPFARHPTRSVTLLVRTDGPAEPLAVPVREAVRAADPSLPLRTVAPLGERIGESLEGRRRSLVVAGAFAVMALLLSAIGLYGVLSHLVRQRTGEIGIRIALGATPRRMLRSVVSSSLGLAAAGVLLGLAGALATGRALRGFLFGVPAGDPATLGGAVLLLLAVAALASWLPARRAARVDPVVALRVE